jgi:hypothetical protein
MPLKKIHFSFSTTAICRQNAQNCLFEIICSNNQTTVTCQMCLDILAGKINLARYKSVSEMPEAAFCRICETEKPIEEMCVAFLRKEKVFRIRPRCKPCHNSNERGNRRAYKKNYLKNWRKKNTEVNRSYWNNPIANEKARINAYRRFEEKHDALLIQGRMKRKGINITTSEAEDLLQTYGKNYPTQHGLSELGRKECERIRASMRRRGRKVLSSFQIRLMVYEDGLEDRKLLKSPHRQKTIYKKASEKLKKYWVEKKKATAKVKTI